MSSFMLKKFFNCMCSFLQNESHNYKNQLRKQVESGMAPDWLQSKTPHRHWHICFMVLSANSSFFAWLQNAVSYFLILNTSS